MRVLAADKRGAVLLLEWRCFHALLPIGLDFASLEFLRDDPRLAEVDARLLVDGGFAPLNPPEWIRQLGLGKAGFGRLESPMVSLQNRQSV